MGKFEELLKLDVNKWVEVKRSGGTDLKYLSWSYAWAEFKKAYPDATYTVAKDEHNRPYFGDDNIGYMVYTSVTADGQTYEMWLPVMDGANKAMKAVPYEYKTKFGTKSVEAMTMFDVNKTVMRCLVKNLAMFGLGLYIYAGEDLPISDEEPAKPENKPKQKKSDPKPEPTADKVVCSVCGAEVKDYVKSDGTVTPALKVLQGCGGKCLTCYNKAKKGE